jgi:hypothetical protein
MMLPPVHRTDRCAQRDRENGPNDLDDGFDRVDHLSPEKHHSEAERNECNAQRIQAKNFAPKWNGSILQVVI